MGRLHAFIGIGEVFISRFRVHESGRPEIETGVIYYVSLPSEIKGPCLPRLLSLAFQEKNKCQK